LVEVDRIAANGVSEACDNGALIGYGHRHRQGGVCCDEGGVVTLKLQILSSGLGGLMMAGTTIAQTTPPQQPPPTPRVHHSACELAESMASRLVEKGIIEAARAQKTCEMLMPTMKPEDAAAFMRCCVKRLTQGPAAPQGQPAEKVPGGRQGT
jgi:hypothetical protein